MPQVGQGGRLAVCLFQLARVTGKGIAVVRWKASLPQLNTPPAQGLVILVGGEHSNILGQAGAAGLIAAVAVEKAHMPDNQVTRVGGDGLYGQAGNIGPA